VVRGSTSNTSIPALPRWPAQRYQDMARCDLRCMRSMGIIHVILCSSILRRGTFHATIKHVVVPVPPIHLETKVRR
jgi:hypothetical protein